VDQFRDNLVSSGYFQALGMSLIKGRLFTEADPADATVVNETMSRRVFGDRDPLGKRIEGLGRPVLVIGVVANLKYAKLDAEPGPEIFRAYSSNLGGGNVNMTLAIRMAGDPLGITPTLRHTIGTIDPSQPVYGIETLQHALSSSVAIRRFELFLLAVFAVAALIMALIGVYGVIAYSVTQRTKEIGIRMAVGAQRAQVMNMIISQGLRIGLWGIAIGVVAASGFTRLMVSLLYGVAPHDPVVFWCVAAMLFFIVALASSGPALRAAFVDPLVALRHE
jgi:putative ABC transport system permease protein